MGIALQVVVVVLLIAPNPALAGDVLGDLINQIKSLSVQGAGPSNELARQMEPSPADVQEEPSPADVQEEPSPADVQEEPPPADVQEPLPADLEEPTSVKVPLVPFEAFPWQVGLVVANEAPASGFFCGGVLVARHWVLTAAHCVAEGSTSSESPMSNEGKPRLDFDVVIGDSSLAKIRKRYAVSQVIVHPKWDHLRYENDIALVETREPVVGVALRLPDSGRGEHPKEGTIGQVVGWGRTQSLGSFSQDLLLLSTTVMSGQNCQGLSRYTFGVLHEGQFCAQSLVRNHDACQGFGGSPLILHDAFGERYVAGLASWSDGCPPAVVKPSVYTNVFWYADWIEQEMQG